LFSSFFFFSAISFFFLSLHSLVFNSSVILSSLSSQYSLSSSLFILSASSNNLDIFLSNHSKSLFLFFDAFA